MKLIELFFVAYAVTVSATWSSHGLNLNSDEPYGCIKSDPEFHLPNSEVLMRLCLFGLPTESRISVRFGDGKSLDHFPIQATDPFPVGQSEDGGSPVSKKILERPNNKTETVIKTEYGSGDRIESETGSLDRNSYSCSSSMKSTEASDRSTSVTTGSCYTVIRHSYSNPGLYRIEAEVVRPQNLTFTISPAWIRISSFEFLLGQVLIFNQTDRVLTLEAARFVAAVRDIRPLPVVEINFGDGTPTKSVELYKDGSLPNWVPSVPWLRSDYRIGRFDHEFAYPGTYTITLNVSLYQPAKGIEKTEMVIAQTTLTVETFAQRIGDHLLFYQPGMRTFPRENVEVVAMVERLPSENTRVDLDFGDGTPSVSVQLDRTNPRPEWTRLNETDHYYWALVRNRFSLSGSFQMKMIISRPDLSESRVVFFCPIVVYDFLVDVKDVRLLFPVAQGQGQNKVTAGEPVTFVILIRSRLETDLEVLLNFGDGAEQQKINYTSVELASLPYGALYDLPDANHVGFAEHVYAIRGSFEARVFVTNIELKRFREATFAAGSIIQVVTCSSLPVWIGGTGVQKTYERWEEIRLDAYVAPGCEDEIIEAGDGEIRDKSSRERGETGVSRGVSREGEMGREGRENGAEMNEAEEIGTDNIEERDEGRENEGISEQEETGEGRERGIEGRGGEDGRGKGGRRTARRLLAEWKITRRIAHSSFAGSSWTTYPKSSGFEIHFPSYSLPVGEYDFQIELMRLSLDDSTPLGRTVNTTKVIIASMNFKVDVEPETQRIDLSTGSIALLRTVIVPEMDWDDLDQPVFYEWFCVTQRLNPDNLDLQDESGCHGDRSKMNETMPLLGIESSRLVFNALPAVYYIYAKAKRSGRTVTSLPAEVWLDSGSDLNITVVCFVNCDEFLSANETLTLSYICSNCDGPSNSHHSMLASSSYFSSSSSSFSSSSFSKDRNLNFSWTIESSETGIDLMKNSITGSNSDWLLVPGLAFYEKLTLENQTHRIRLTVTGSLRRHGRASYAVSVSARLKPSLQARGDVTNGASSFLVLAYRRLLLCVTINGILPQIASLGLPYMT